MARRVKHDLVAMKHLVQGLLDSLPDFNWQHPEHFRAAENALRKALEAKGARFDDRDGILQMTFAAVRATSTNGAAGAMRNWVKAANRKLDRTSFVGGAR